MAEEERPELETKSGSLPKQWKPMQKAEERALSLTEGILPNKLRASDAQYEELYLRAYNLYQAGRYKEAKAYLSLLVMGKPQEPRYLSALAAAHHMLKEYQNAITLYTLCYIMNPENVKVQYHVADCWMQLNELPNAWIALQMGIKKAGDAQQHKAIKERMLIMQEKIGKELKAKQEMGLTSLRGNYIPSDVKILLDEFKLPNDVQELDKMLKSGEAKEKISKHYKEAFEDFREKNSSI